jgi:hypothetical protein
MMQGCVDMKTKILYGLAPMLFLSACGQPEPITYESLSLVNSYYVEHPVQSLTPTAGGWLFRGARENGNEIRVGFLVPRSLNPDQAKRHAVLDKVCPARSELIWQVLPPGNKIVISVFTEDNKFKDHVVC